MPSNKTFRTKLRLSKAYKSNKPIPQWYRLKPECTQGWNHKRRHWRRGKLNI